MTLHPTPETSAARRRLGTMRDAAEALGIPLASAYELARDDRLPGVVRIGRLVRIDLERLDAWIDSGGDNRSGNA